MFIWPKWEESSAFAIWSLCVVFGHIFVFLLGAEFGVKEHFFSSTEYTIQSLWDKNGKEVHWEEF